MDQHLVLLRRTFLVVAIVGRAASAGVIPSASSALGVQSLAHGGGALVLSSVEGQAAARSCSWSLGTGLTNASWALPPTWDDAALLLVALASPEAAESQEAVGWSGAEAQGWGEWEHFVGEMRGYAADATAYAHNLEQHAWAWAGLAQEWAFFTAPLPPYNAALGTARPAVDLYTGDVSAYASALSSFAAGLAAAAQDAALDLGAFSALASALCPHATYWGDAQGLAQQAQATSRGVAYLGTYSVDLAQHAHAWFENVGSLWRQDANATRHSFPLHPKAQYLLRYAGDLAAFANDWAQSAADTEAWALDWIEYGRLYG